MKHHKREFGTAVRSISGVAPGHPGVRKGVALSQDNAGSGPPDHWRRHYERTRGPAVQAGNSTAEGAMREKEKHGGR